MVRHATTGSENRMRAADALEALKKNNSSVREDISGAMMGNRYKKLQLLLGTTPGAWADGRNVTNETILAGMRLAAESCEMMGKFIDAAVGVRREYLETILVNTVPTMGQGYAMTSNDEPCRRFTQEETDRWWG